MWTGFVAFFSDKASPAEFTAAEIEAQIHIAPGVMLNPVHARLVRKLLEKHRSLFRSNLADSYCHVVSHKIELKPGAVPFRATPRVRQSPEEEVAAGGRASSSGKKPERSVKSTIPVDQASTGGAW